MLIDTRVSIVAFCGRSLRVADLALMPVNMLMTMSYLQTVELLKAR